MNEQRSAQRQRPQGQPRTPEQRRRAQAAKHRRQQQNRRFRRFLLCHQIILVLICLAIGYFLGLRAGKNAATVPEVPTDPPAATNGAVSGDILTPQEPGDTTAPTILGVNKLSVFVGSTVAYRSGILVTDDTDPNPKLTVDSSFVNLSAPGTYQLVYAATDSAGNTSKVQTTVTVVEAPESYVDEALIKETADQLLAKILTEGQTPEQQVNAIYDWMEGHCYYIAEFDKSDYMQAAYLMMTEHRGDCYGFYALSRLLFDRLGLPNLTVTRLPNEVRTSRHWWNMVSLDGGESWYHFDAIPHMTHPTRTCLVTDADLEAFNQLMPNYYYYDQAGYPRSPDRAS